MCLVFSGEEGLDLIAGGPCSTCYSQGEAADPSLSSAPTPRPLLRLVQVVSAGGHSGQGQVEAEIQTLSFFPSHVSLPGRSLPRGRMPFLNVTKVSPLPSTGSVRPSSSHLGGIFF